MLIKTAGIFLLVLLLPIITIAQRYSSERGYEVTGLENASVVGKSCLYGLVACAVGFIICKLSISKDEKGVDKTSNWFFLGLGCFFVAFLFFLPLLSWVEFAVVNLLTLGLAIVVIGSIGILIYGWLKG
ncbi:hypothetical protein [Dyadobacter frigoris]|uniref:Uncharacterized protein n=1 Tax=Dyadobacter frigoris TaxID=2576211 RepID=A0A4U6DCD8_9BACT|nr:hypothetical protein [Dyadobacter frigoris]TKT94161.1 hypothetical protein FDK13_02825 [Dyadobacter frigoris]